MVHKVHDTQEGYCYRHCLRFAMCYSNELIKLVAYELIGIN